MWGGPPTQIQKIIQRMSKTPHSTNGRQEVKSNLIIYQLTGFMEMLTNGQHITPLLILECGQKDSPTAQSYLDKLQFFSLISIM